MPAGPAPTPALTRRRILAGAAVAFVFPAQSPLRNAKVDQPPNQTRTFLHQEICVTGSPQRIYHILLDAAEFSAFTQTAAHIDPREGGAFSLFDGAIAGRNVELLPDQRIVQAWRASHWDAGLYSIVRIQLSPQDPGAIISLDHTGFPVGEYDHLLSGWQTHYWDPLKKFLA